MAPAIQFFPPPRSNAHIEQWLQRKRGFHSRLWLLEMLSKEDKIGFNGWLQQHAQRYKLYQIPDIRNFRQVREIYNKNIKHRNYALFVLRFKSLSNVNRLRALRILELSGINCFKKRGISTCYRDVF